MDSKPEMQFLVFTSLRRSSTSSSPLMRLSISLWLFLMSAPNLASSSTSTCKRPSITIWANLTWEETPPRALSSCSWPPPPELSSCSPALQLAPAILRSGDGFVFLLNTKGETIDYDNFHAKTKFMPASKKALLIRSDVTPFKLWGNRIDHRYIL